MPFNFPANPQVGAVSQQNGRSYRYAGGNVWELAVVGSTDSRWDLFLPPAPTELTATGGNAQVALSWTAPTTLAQTPITDYAVQFSSNGGSTWTTFADGTSTATSVTVNSLANGTPYVFRVAAVNAIGTGPYTAASESVTPGDVFRAIPTMTSNTAPSGESNGTTNGGQDSDVWQIFDQNASTQVWFNRGPGNNPKRRFQYAFPDGQKSRISGYAITLNDVNGDSIPRNWNFYGSDDLTTWTLIESRTDTGTIDFGVWFNSSISNGQSRSFTLSQVANYRAYRWVINEDVDGAGPHVITQVSLLA